MKQKTKRTEKNARFELIFSSHQWDLLHISPARFHAIWQVSLWEFPRQSGELFAKQKRNEVSGEDKSKMKARIRKINFVPRRTVLRADSKSARHSLATRLTVSFSIASSWIFCSVLIILLFAFLEFVSRNSCQMCFLQSSKSNRNRNCSLALTPRKQQKSATTFDSCCSTISRASTSGCSNNLVDRTNRLNRSFRHFSFPSNFGSDAC